MSSLAKRFQNFVFHKRLFERGDGIVVGVSGGPDSTCLTMILNDLKEKHELRLFLVHVNYGLRDKDSEKDEQFVRELARKLELRLKVAKYRRRMDSRLRGNDNKGESANLEELMRDFRYKKFEEIRKQKKFDWIAVGHTLNDQAETFFMNLIRGSGMKGLGAMSEKRDRIIRPLIEFEKKEIVQYLKEKHQSYCTDKSNFDRKLLRNRIRLGLIPYIESDYHAQIKERVSDLSWQMRNGDSFIEEIAKKKYNKVVSLRREGRIELKLHEYKQLEPVFQGIVFRKAIERLKGNKRNLSKANFFEFEKIIKSGKGKNQKMVIGKILIEKKGGEVTLKIV